MEQKPSHNFLVPPMYPYFQTHSPAPLIAGFKGLLETQHL